jgi:hypothetical protein
MDPPPPPQMHGVVIITLPPPDQPSKGKTVTAFTYTDDPAAPPPPPPPEPVMGYPAVAGVRRSRQVLSARRVGPIALLLGSVAAYYCVYSDVAVQFLGLEQEAQRNETRSFLLPLYPKARQGRALRDLGDVKPAARRVSEGGGGKKAKNKMEVKKAAANSTALLPVKGNVFPDGCVQSSSRSISIMFRFSISVENLGSFG